MSEFPEEENLESTEGIETGSDHSEVWGGSTEISPEGEALEADVVEQDFAGEAPQKTSASGEEAGEEGENPLEVEGYDPPTQESNETSEALMTEAIQETNIQAGEAMFVQETVLGPDDRRKITNTRVFPWRTICYLEITAADGRRYLGTGNFIGPHTVMTAGHCIYMHRHGGWVRSIRVIPGANGSSEPYGSATAVRFVTVRGWIRSRSPNYDYGAIILSSDTIGRRVGWMGFAALTWLSLIRLRINNSGYPADKPRKTQWWNCNRIVFVSPRRVYYLLDTYGGQSGSPVWRYRNGRRHQIAIHAYGGTSSNSGTRIIKPVFDNMLRWRR
jgi:V8-like Glu-specific endopeptidase